MPALLLSLLIVALAPILGGLGRGVVVAGVCGGLALGASILYRSAITPTDFWTHLGLFAAQACAFAVALATLAVVWKPPELAFAVDRVWARLKRKLKRG